MEFKGDGIKAKKSEVTKLAKYKQNCVIYFLRPCEVGLRGFGGNPKSPDAFRHFGAQNDIFFVLEQSLFLFKGFIKNTTKKS